MSVPPELRDIAHDERELASFTNLHRRRGLVFVPASEEELQRIFRWAGAARARVTIRSAGHSFDDQALPDDPRSPRAEPHADDVLGHVTVVMSRFDSIRVDADRHRVTVGPGATWGAILRRLEPLGLVPYVTVTTEHATAGGTLSADCLSRFSPAYGKEGHHIESFVVVTPDGARHVCKPPRDKDPPASLEERLFCGVVGGLGYLGVVTSITYDLLHVGQTNGRIGVESQVFKYDSFRQLATELLPLVHRAEARERGERHPKEPDSIWSALSAHGGRERSLVIHSRFTATPDREPMPCHQPSAMVRVPVEWLLRVPWLTGPLWSYFFWLIKTDKKYIDDLAGFTFMMDGTVRAKDIAQSLGFTQRAIQQTFIIPVRSDRHASETADERLLSFVTKCDARFKAARVEPTLMDVLYIPKDEHFLLSASTGMSGFAVSFAFETSNQERIKRIEQCFIELAEECYDAGGRVHLVKNVRVRPETLARMYKGTLPAFFALKREVDPNHVLRNAFFDRNFDASASAEPQGSAVPMEPSGDAAA
jgi:decaprenylphospho-beta-D-ribofuranose 2-oxidase